MRGMKRRGKYLPVIFAMLCVAYFINLTLFSGYLNVFHTIWLFIGAALLAIYYFWNKLKVVYGKLPKVIKMLAVIALGLFCASFIVIEALALSQMRGDAEPRAAYVIILGARVNGNTPSITLRKRAAVAARYLNTNPDTKVIATGGKGAGEYITEGEALRQLLETAGIDKSRIIIEDASTSTWENLTNAASLLDSLHTSVVLVSSDFHLFRATGMAKKLGYTHISAAASKSEWQILPNYLLREYLAIIHDIMLKHL
jgi:uncharacterized SAM-binding protein YcdF (DUF218 family)